MPLAVVGIPRCRPRSVPDPGNAMSGTGNSEPTVGPCRRAAAVIADSSRKPTTAKALNVGSAGRVRVPSDTGRSGVSRRGKRADNLTSLSVAGFPRSSARCRNRQSNRASTLKLSMEATVKSRPVRTQGGHASPSSMRRTSCSVLRGLKRHRGAAQRPRPKSGKVRKYVG